MHIIIDIIIIRHHNLLPPIVNNEKCMNTALTSRRFTYISLYVLNSNKRVRVFGSHNSTSELPRTANQTPCFPSLRTNIRSSALLEIAKCP